MSPQEPDRCPVYRARCTGPGAAGPVVVGPPQKKPVWGGVHYSEKPRSGVVSFVPNRSTGTGGRDRVLVFQDQEMANSDDEDTRHKGSGDDGSPESVHV